MWKMTIGLLACLSFLVGCQQITKEDDIKIDASLVDDIKIGAKVNANYDYKGKTYLWAGSDIVINDPSGKWWSPDFDFKGFIKQSIEDELKRKGLSESEKGADLVVTYGIDLNMAAIRMKEFPGLEEVLVVNVPEGALSIYVIDRVKDKVLWVGWANADVRQRGEDVARQRLKYIVNEIFKKFPM